MALLKLDGRQLELPPLKLGGLRRAAPFIDAINATGGALTTLEGATKAARHFLDVIAIAAEKLDAELTADAMEDMMGMEDIPAIQKTLSDLLAESGLAPKGEANASQPATAKARGSKSKSAE